MAREMLPCSHATRRRQPSSTSWPTCGAACPAWATAARRAGMVSFTETAALEWAGAGRAGERGGAGLHRLQRHGPLPTRDGAACCAPWPTRVPARALWQRGRDRRPASCSCSARRPVLHQRQHAARRWRAAAGAHGLRPCGEPGMRLCRARRRQTLQRLPPRRRRPKVLALNLSRAPYVTTAHEHLEIQKTLKRFIDAEINPHVDEWEEAEMFPAHEVFKKLGNLGLLGLTKPEAYRRRRAGLLAMPWPWPRTCGHIDCGGVPMAIGVQTDMCHAGAGALRQRRAAATSSWRRRSPATWWAASASVEPGAGQRRGLASRPRARKDGDDYVDQRPARCGSPTALQADWMCMLANTGERPAHRNKSLVMVPHERRKGIEVAQQDPQDRHELQRHRPAPLRRRAGAAALPHRRGGPWASPTR